MINPAIENDLKRMSLNDVNYDDYIKENYIQIPDNATNGDVMELIFDIYLLDFKKMWGGGSVTDDWWNSPYKADKEGD